MGIRSTAMAGAAPFAHLLGLGRASAAKAAEQTEKDREDEREGEEEREEDARAAGDLTEENDGDDDNDSNPNAETEVDDADDEEDDEAEMRGKAAARVRRAERARCEAIFASAAAAGQPHVAAQLAFKTNMSAKSAIEVLKATAANMQPAKPARQSLDQRMAANRAPVIGGGPAASRSPDPDADMAARIIAAGRKRRGEV